MKPKLPTVTLVSVDCTDKAHLAERAIDKSLEQCTFGAVKLLTHDLRRKHSVQIPKIKSLEEYSRFCVRDLHKHIGTPFCLLVQFDGFCLNGSAWTDDFLKYDYVGAPFNPSGVVGNGGFSLRSTRMMKFIAESNWDDPHPEDSAICIRHRAELEAKGFKFAPRELAERFSFEGRSWNSREWMGTPNEYKSQFGFHSWLSKLPKGVAPHIAHHSGDAGDVIYSLATLKALGGAMLFISIDNRYPYPLPTRWARMGGEASFVDNIAPLIEAQPYMWGCRYTHGLPHSTTIDLNRFREPWRTRTARDFDSIFQLHGRAFGLTLDETKPWLTVDNTITVPGRPIVVARSPRYQNLSFEWDKLLQKLHSKVVFVGTDAEYEIFRGFAPEVKFPHYMTKDALELARVIAGAELLIANQSLPLAISHGLGKNVVVEEWELNRNCHLNRKGAFYGFPEHLL